MSLTSKERLAKSIESFEYFKKIHPECLGTISVCERLIGSNPFDDTDDLCTALYYLTNEDYFDVAPAMLFFARKLI